jgi:hypothetical protein
MTHAREHGDVHVFHCDTCPASDEGEPGEDFREAWLTLREQGWVCFQDVEGVWCHRCPSCAEED